jgi:quercetin dioxygenase-like cupin family protein
MKYQLPHSIENSIGEKVIFKSIESLPGGDKVLVESFCHPGGGPPMHTHFKQDECLTIVAGTMGYQVLGEEPKIALAGDTVFFKKGTPHKFWVVGDESLHCKGYIQPVNTIIFFLSAVFAAQNKSGKGEPESFDGAYLLTRYASEYDMAEIPSFVKKVVLPITCFAGRVLGKYRHFKDAPAPVK